MRRRPASLSAAHLCSPSGILRASAITSVARSSQKRLSGGGSAFFTVIALCRWREGLPECIGPNHHLVKEITPRALKRADIETHTCRHDASEYHVSAAFWASRAMDMEIDVVRQEIGFLHIDFPSSRRRESSPTKYFPEATLTWRDQLALEPVHYLFGLQGITELHRRLKLMRATMTFKDPKVIA
jgi:hypothetical protein